MSGFSDTGELCGQSFVSTKSAHGRASRDRSELTPEWRSRQLIYLRTHETPLHDACTRLA